MTTTSPSRQPPTSNLRRSPSRRSNQSRPHASPARSITGKSARSSCGAALVCARRHRSLDPPGWPPDRRHALTSPASGELGPGGLPNRPGGRRPLRDPERHPGIPDSERGIHARLRYLAHSTRTPPHDSDLISPTRHHQDKHTNLTSPHSRVLPAANSLYACGPVDCRSRPALPCVQLNIVQSQIRDEVVPVAEDPRAFCTARATNRPPQPCWMLIPPKTPSGAMLAATSFTASWPRRDLGPRVGYPGWRQAFPGPCAPN